MAFSTDPATSFSLFATRIGVDDECEVTGGTFTDDLGNREASVNLYNYNTGIGAAAGGSVFHHAGAIINVAEITIEQLEACFDEQISNLEQNGANGTFETDNYIGFKFTLDAPVGELEAGPHEFKIGSGEFPVPGSNTQATADAGPDQSVASEAPVTLDGTGSSDPDIGQTLAYAWTAPAGVTLSDATASSPTFTAPTRAAGDADLALIFSLIVTDDDNLASTEDTVTITVISGPTVALSGGPEAITNTNPFTITGTFSKAVSGFGDFVADVIVTNGSVTGITGGPSVYTLDITPTGAGDISITIPAAAAQDAVGNPNPASNTLLIGNQIVADTQKAIAGFMLGRANSLASNQPSLTRFLEGEGCGSFSAKANENAGSVSGCASSGNTWAEISSSWGDGNSYTLGTVGAHSFVNPDLIVGGMFQFDNAKDEANKASGTGWMIGPYFAAKMPDQPLFFEGRLLYGQSDNKISPLDTFTDSFKTERMLAQLRASGEYKLENTTLMPLFDLTYTDDAQKAYTDSLGNTIPGQKVSLTQVTAGMDFKTPLPSQSGALDLTGGLSGIYTATQAGAAAKQDFEGGRGRAHVGLNYTTGTGATLFAGTFYDGIGSKHEAYGASLDFNWKF
jgi:outer membrane autotransporter protein